MVCRVALQGLYVLTDDVLLAGCLLQSVESVVAAGCKVVQYRSKQKDVAAREEEAASLVAICRRYGALLLVNDDPQLAVRVGADGVHLGQEDVSLREAREWLGPQAIIGVTCHGSLDLARVAQNQGADYVAFGRFFNSDTKPDAEAASLDILVRARQELVCPVVAIGGITLDNAAPLVSAGADMLAVIGGVFGGAARDASVLTRRVQQFQSLFDIQLSGAI